MQQTKSLMNRQAIEKIKEIAENNICLFCTTDEGKVSSRPMQTQGIDDDGTLWFFSKKESEKNLHLKKEDKVYLMYMETSKQQYLSLTGYAEVVDDHGKIEKLWNKKAKAWFSGGKNDPSLTLLKVTPELGHYWDTKNGLLISTIKIAVAALTGDHPGGIIEGEISV